MCHGSLTHLCKNFILFHTWVEFEHTRFGLGSVTAKIRFSSDSFCLSCIGVRFGSFKKRAVLQFGSVPISNCQPHKPCNKCKWWTSSLLLLSYFYCTDVNVLVKDDVQFFLQYTMHDIPRRICDTTSWSSSEWCVNDVNKKYWCLPRHASCWYLVV